MECPTEMKGFVKFSVESVTNRLQPARDGDTVGGEASVLVVKSQHDQHLRQSQQAEHFTLVSARWLGSMRGR